MTGTGELTEPSLQQQQALKDHQRWLDTGGQEGRQLTADSAGWKWRGLNLRGANFSLAEMRCSEFNGSDLRGADFTNADVASSYFNDTDLRGTRFNEADVSHCQFKGTLRDDATSYDNAILFMTTFTDEDTRQHLALLSAPLNNPEP